MAERGAVERVLGAGLLAAANAKVVEASAPSLDRCARALGCLLSLGLSAGSSLATRTARSIERAGGPTPRAQLAMALAVVPPMAELSAGPLAGRAAAVLTEALVLAVAASAARAHVARRGAPEEAWSPLFRAALSSTSARAPLGYALATAAAPWVEADLRGLPAISARPLAQALVARGPSRFAALPIDVLVGALPSPIGALRLLARAMAQGAIVNGVEREVDRLLARPIAHVVPLRTADRSAAARLARAI